jgi:hypothetical protein
VSQDSCCTSSSYLVCVPGRIEKEVAASPPSSHRIECLKMYKQAGCLRGESLLGKSSLRLGTSSNALGGPKTQVSLLCVPPTEGPVACVQLHPISLILCHGFPLHSFDCTWVSIVIHHRGKNGGSASCFVYATQRKFFVCEDLATRSVRSSRSV